MILDTILYSLLSGILPALLWLWFWVKEDNLHPEPKRTIILAFIAGAASVVVALLIEKIIADSGFGETTNYILWAATEEIVKLLAVSIIAFSTKELDEPIDAMIYCITVALGFSALENTLFIFSPLNSGNITGSIVTGSLRFMGATLVHVVSSASIGFMIGLTLFRSVSIKTIAIIFGVILAMTLHAAFNLSIINMTAAETLKVFGWVWGAIVILLILFEEIKVVKPKAQ